MVGKIRFKRVLVFAISALVSQQALSLDPANTQLGSVYIEPTLDIEVRNDDNLYRNQDIEISDTVAVVRPVIQAWLQNNNNSYALIYELESGNYSKESDNDYTDNKLNLDIHQELNSKNVIDIYAEYDDAHEDRGTGLTEGDLGLLIDKPVEFQATKLGGIYSLGNRLGKGRLELEAQTRDIEYQNYREQTQYRDRQDDMLRATLYYKVAPKTDALLEVRGTRTDYKIDPVGGAGSLDSKETVYLVGLSWFATAKTTGSVKVGGYRRDYEDNDRGAYDGFHWEADVTWKPRTYSEIVARMARKSYETNSLGDFVNTDEYSLGWNHDWNARLSHDLILRLSKDTYEGTTRRDDRFDTELRFNYAFRRWFDIGAGYRYFDRDTTADGFNYQRNLWFLDVRLSL
ncbi:MAG: outer membrane beta-barrel protein [Pseudomonadales bacterium]